MHQYICGAYSRYHYQRQATPLHVFLKRFTESCMQIYPIDEEHPLVGLCYGNVDRVSGAAYTFQCLLKPFYKGAIDYTEKVIGRQSFGLADGSDPINTIFDSNLDDHSLSLVIYETKSYYHCWQKIYDVTASLPEVKHARCYLGTYLKSNTK